MPLYFLFNSRHFSEKAPNALPSLSLHLSQIDLLYRSEFCHPCLPCHAIFLPARRRRAKEDQGRNKEEEEGRRVDGGGGVGSA